MGDSGIPQPFIPAFRLKIKLRRLLITRTSADTLIPGTENEA